MKKVTLVLLGGGVLAVLAYFFVFKKKSATTETVSGNTGSGSGTANVSQTVVTTSNLPITTGVPVIITNPNTLDPVVTTTITTSPKVLPPVQSSHIEDAVYIGHPGLQAGTFLLNPGRKISGYKDQYAMFHITAIDGMVFNDDFTLQLTDINFT